MQRSPSSGLSCRQIVAAAFNHTDPRLEIAVRALRPPPGLIEQSSADGGCGGSRRFPPPGIRSGLPVATSAGEGTGHPPGCDVVVTTASCSRCASRPQSASTRAVCRSHTGPATRHAICSWKESSTLDGFLRWLVAGPWSSGCKILNCEFGVCNLARQDRSAAETALVELRVAELGHPNPTPPAPEACAGSTPISSPGRRRARPRQWSGQGKLKALGPGWVRVNQAHRRAQPGWPPSCEVGPSNLSWPSSSTRPAHPGRRQASRGAGGAG